MNIQPVNNLVLIEVPAKKDKSDGGIILTAAAQKEMKETCIGTVRGTGEAVTFTLCHGEMAIYNPYYARSCKSKGKEFVLIEDKHVLAVIKGESND